MTVGRIATFASTSALLKSALSTQSVLAETLAAQASGKKSTTLSGLSHDVAAYLSYSSELATLASGSRSASQGASRLESIYALVGNVGDLAATIRTTLASWQGDQTDIATRAQEWLSDLQSLLNTKSGGHYLLSGQASDIAPAAFAALGVANASTSDQSYYQGSSSSSVVHLRADASLRAYPQANDPAFELLVRCLSVLAQATTPVDVIADAFELAGAAITGLGKLQETISARTQTLERYIAQADARADALEAMASGLTDTDPAEATLLAKRYETQLQAVYASLADTMRLSLLDYL